MNKKHFPKYEEVAKIKHRNPDFNDKYVFNRNYETFTQRNIRSFIGAAMHGNGDPVVHVHETTDRNSDYIYGVAPRFDGYEIVRVSLPVNVLTWIEDYQATEDEDEAKKLERRINNYFETP